MTHSCLRVGFCAALWLALPPRLPGQAPDTVFVATASGDTAVDLAPIAIFDAGRFDSLPSGDEDSTSELFRRLAYSPHRHYWLYSGGVRVAEFRATGPGIVGCTGLPGFGQATPKLPSGWQGLAATDSNSALRGTRRSPLAQELVTLRNGAGGLLVEAGAPATIAKNAKLLEGWTFEDPSTGVRWLVGGFRTETHTDSGGTDVQAAFLLIEIEKKGQHIALSWKHGGIEDDAQLRFPVDLFDFDHDGFPELITMTSYYESWDYQVWKRRANGWVLWVNTGGAGC